MNSAVGLADHVSVDVADDERVDAARGATKDTSVVGGQ